MPKTRLYRVMREVSTVYEIEVEAHNVREAQEKVMQNEYDGGDVMSESDGSLDKIISVDLAERDWRK